MMKTWFITGSSSGLGAAIAEEALERGDRAVITARSPERLRPLQEKFPKTSITLSLDVLDNAAISHAVQKTMDWSGGIDVLVNNAGRGLHGAVEEVSDAEVRALFDLNVFSLLAVTREILPVMRKQRRGLIFNMSSAAGFAGDAGSGLYAASKFAVEGISESMAVEVAPLGIKVVALAPGPFRTDFAGRSLLITQNSIGDYVETAGKRSMNLRAANGSQPGDPKKAARLICDVAELGEPPLHLCIGPASYAKVRGKLTKVLASMDEWEARATATNFDAV